MSFFPIPADKFGTKQKKVQLTNENKKVKREAKRSRSHTINSVKKNRQKIDQQAAIRIKNIRDIIDINSIQYVRNTGLIAALCVQNGIFDDARIARIFIENYKEKIFITGYY